MSLEQWIKFLFPPCPICKFYIKHCKCGKLLNNEGIGL